MLFSTVLALVVALSVPASAGTKEMLVQLQTQVQFLQDQMARMQQGFNERMGVMRSLVEQNADQMNQMVTRMEGVEQLLRKENAASGEQVENLAGQIQSLHDSLDELKVRVAKLNQYLEGMSTSRETVLPAPAPGGGDTSSTQAPPAPVLYRNALADYNAGRYDLAMQQFTDYLRFYPTGELAGDAQFYVAEINYRRDRFQEAVEEYDKVLEQYPGGNKAAAAQLKKGFALLQMGEKDAAVRELDNLIARYPQSPEAAQARERMRDLKPSPARRGSIR